MTIPANETQAEMFWPMKHKQKCSGRFRESFYLPGQSQQGIWCLPIPGPLPWTLPGAELVALQPRVKDGCPGLSGCLEECQQPVPLNFSSQKLVKGLVICFCSLWLSHF